MLWNKEGSLRFVWVLMCELCPRTPAQPACTEHPACAMHALAPRQNHDQCRILLSWKMPRSKQEEKSSIKVFHSELQKTLNVKKLDGENVTFPTCQAMTKP